MMYALGDMDGIICLAGALCKTWALLFTGEFGSRSPMINANGGLTHVRGEVWVTAWGEVKPQIDLPTCAEKFGLPALTDKQDQVNYPRVQRSLEHHAGISVTHTELPTFAVEFVNTKSS